MVEPVAVKQKDEVLQNRIKQVAKPKAVACNDCWSLDFTALADRSVALTDGRKFRTLNVLDDYNREALGIEAVRRRG